MQEDRHNDSRISIAEPWIGEGELELVTEAVRSGWVSSSGKFIAEFEEKFAAFCEARHGAAVSNGTTALHLALVALGIGPGDEVLIPALTFVATANVVTFTGARPVLVDVSPGYWGMEVSQLEKKLTPRTKAIIPVHLYGHPCDMDAINSFAAEHNLFVIEDAAEAHGAEVRGKRVGGLGHVGCFSFYGNKIVTTGEGGMCVTNDAALHARMQYLKSHGMRPERRYWHEEVAFNYRMTNVQAAMGVAQMRKVDEMIAAKRRIAAQYRERLMPLERAGLLRLPVESNWAHSVYWLYSITIERDDLSPAEAMASLLDLQIETRPLFIPIHKLPPYREMQSYPVAERVSERGLSLPSGVLLSSDDVDRVCAAVQAALAR
jgi:perosamine synthetase